MRKQKKKLTLHRETLRSDLSQVSGGTMMFQCDFSDSCQSCDSCFVSCKDTCTKFPNCASGGGGTLPV